MDGVSGLGLWWGQLPQETQIHGKDVQTAFPTSTSSQE